jgi:hypothetical protein
MKERGVLGGSELGATFFHASTKFSSAVGAAGRSVENGRALALAEERSGRARRPVARRNMVGSGGSLGSRSVGERGLGATVLWPGCLVEMGKGMAWLVRLCSCGLLGCLAAADAGLLCGVECGFSHAIC